MTRAELDERLDRYLDRLKQEQEIIIAMSREPQQGRPGQPPVRESSPADAQHGELNAERLRAARICAELADEHADQASDAVRELRLAAAMIVRGDLAHAELAERLVRERETAALALLPSG